MNSASVLDQQLPARRRPDGLGRALEKPCAELGLEPRDLVAECGLNDVRSLGRTGEVECFRDGDDVLELAEIHRESR